MDTSERTQTAAGDVDTDRKATSRMNQTAVDFKCWRFPEHDKVLVHPKFGWPACAICQAAVPYHERPSYLPEGFTLDVYVPHKVGSYQHIALGSGVVGLTEGDEAWVYYEGWVNGPMQYADRDARGLWEAGVEHAAGRMVTAYPTVATCRLDAWDVTKVGTYNPRTRELIVTDEQVLEAWL